MVGQLQPQISPGYGFAAIIVAFLGRLNPLGVLFAGLLLALSYIGGEAAQITLGISDKIAKVFQGILLFFILACDTLILYRINFDSGAVRRAQAGGVGPWTRFIAVALTIMTAATPLLLAAIGELVVERSGVLNLGVEGMMVMGAVCGFGAAFLTGSPWLGVVAAIVAGMVHVAAVRVSDADAGLQPGGDRPGADASRPRPLGLDRRSLRRPARRQAAEVWRHRSRSFPVSFLLTAAVAYVLFRTKTGLIVRAVGNSHASAHALGYRVIARALSLRDVRRRLRRPCRRLSVARLYAAMDGEHDGGPRLDCAGARRLRLLAAVAHASVGAYLFGADLDSRLYGADLGAGEFPRNSCRRCPILSPYWRWW